MAGQLAAPLAAAGEVQVQAAAGRGDDRAARSGEPGADRAGSVRRTRCRPGRAGRRRGRPGPARRWRSRGSRPDARRHHQEILSGSVVASMIAVPGGGLLAAGLAGEDRPAVGGVGQRLVA